LLARVLDVPPAKPSGYWRPPESFFRTHASPWTGELTARLGPIFCFGDDHDARRIRQGKHNTGRLDPSERYGFTHSGYRLLSLGVSNDGTVPEVAYDDFKWCGLGEVTATTPVSALDIPGHYRWTDRDRFVFKVTPNRADGIYVADNAPYEARRSELLAQIAPRDRLTDAELADADRARARTIVPAAGYGYAGGFSQPVLLVGRELGFDEVELVSGPWPRS
jgi:hypothetical protein